MDQPIKITSREVLQHDRSSCKFTVDSVLSKEGIIRFKDIQAAKDSLRWPNACLALKALTAVLIQNSDVVVTKKEPVDWRATGPLVGVAIRAHLATGQPAILPQAFQNASSEDQLRNKVQKILDEQINPAVASHGGYITLVDVQGKNLYIQMGGGCQGCGQANVTLRDGVEESLRAQVPEIGEILDATDHAAGENPYYAQSGH